MVFQKNRAAFNKLIRSAILDAVRGSIPVENLLRAYLDESTDLLKEEIKDKEPLKEIEIAETTAPKKSIPVEVVDIGPIVEMSKELEKDPVLNIIDIAKEPTIRFMDQDSAISVAGVPELIHAPKDDETLKRIAEQRASDRKEQESSDTLSISDENIITDLPIEVLV